MKNVLFLGRFYPKGVLKSISKDTRGKVAFSNHNFEMSLIRGFATQENVNLKVLTAPIVFSYPHNNKNLKINPEQYIENGISIHSIGFNNIVGLNILSTIKNLTQAIKEELNSFTEESVTVIVNTPSIILSSALFKALKATTKKVTTILIVPDVPECMLEMNGKLSLKGRIVKLLNKRTAELSKRYDKYVFLTEAMNEFYNVPSSDYIVMEGLIADSQAELSASESTVTEPNQEIILYTGTLRRIFGIMDLIEVFEKGQFPNTELWICGSGECAEAIEKKAQQNPNIKFLGLVDSSTSRKLQSQATILANPRSAKGEYTKYSFPSKTIEYLLAGKTVIMNKLPGIPEEYDEYIHYPDNESVQSWINTIRIIFSTNPINRQVSAQNGKVFVQKNKTALIQCKRILNLTI